MALAETCFPISTDYDAVEDPAGSIDPLGTLGDAERFANILLPGLTARMYRVRLLTVTALSAVIAERVVHLMDGREDVRLEARLTFERLLVSSIVRLARDEDDGRISRRVPGRRRALEALQRKEPLTIGNFLKGPAVNGPFGVMARLARALEIVDDQGKLGRKAPNVLLAWSEDESLAGILDEPGTSKRDGARWVGDAARTVKAWISEREWPGRNQKIWEQLALHVRPDIIRGAEKRALVTLLDADPARRRVLEILRERQAVQIYRDQRELTRGRIERTTLLKGVRPQLSHTPIDRVIDGGIAAVDAYESVTGLFQQGFDTVRWGLVRKGGAVSLQGLLLDDRVRRHVEKTILRLNRLRIKLKKTIENMSTVGPLDRSDFINPLVDLESEAAAGVSSPSAFLEMLLDRHERIQKEKKKAAWIDRARCWTLMPGFGIVQEAPPDYDASYQHPFRIQNAYAFLGDLGRVSVVTGDEED